MKFFEIIGLISCFSFCLIVLFLAFQYGFKSDRQLKREIEEEIRERNQESYYINYKGELVCDEILWH